ncbi:MAG: sterol desaturase family protein [Acidobacteria bacterium]|nr:sterol desaturase family protein [Acidobacteriota bacterium]
MSYWDLFIQSFSNYARYLGQALVRPDSHNYVYWLLGISFLVYALELAFPWRQDQPRIRQDFWLDAFYMFFNFFLFGLIGYVAASDVLVQAFKDFLAQFGIRNLVAIQVNQLPTWAQLLTLFVVRDFIHFNVHRLLHRIPFLWNFHKVHHSVKQMGFAAHLRYHWMENVVYRSLEYIPIAMIGFGIDDFLIVHLTALTIGHLNHANFRLPMGPLRYLFNSAEMHIWHHVKDLPAEKPYGINFGISLSLWDYVFGTNYQPYLGRDLSLGYPGDQEMPTGFLRQLGFGFRRTKSA